jgi:hypothetical protein
MECPCGKYPNRGARWRRLTNNVLSRWETVLFASLLLAAGIAIGVALF